MSEADVIAEVTAALLAPGAPPLLRATGLETSAAPQVRVFVAARHAPVTAILCDEAQFSLRHYDELLAQVAGPCRYLVGENDAARQLRLRLLHAAQAHVDSVRKAAPATLPPHLDPDYRAFIAAIAREEADHILDVLAPRRRTGETVNFAREYAFLLAYRMARRIVGVPGPDRPPLTVRAMIALRNLQMGGHWVRLQGEAGTATTMLCLLQPLFGHVFGTIVQSPTLLRRITTCTAASALAAFDHTWENPDLAPPDSLLAGLKAVRRDFPRETDEDYRIQARSVLFELAGALVLIVGKALSAIAGLATSPQGKAAGIDWPDLVTRLTPEEERRTGHDAVINEMLRLAGGTRLVRTVRSDCTWQGVALHAGDRILLLTDEASRDPAVFAEPARFAPDPHRPYITSGPLQGPHVCYGRAIAWTILREAIVATHGRIVPAANAGLSEFLGLPDNLPFTAI